MKDLTDRDSVALADLFGLPEGTNSVLVTKTQAEGLYRQVQQQLREPSDARDLTHVRGIRIEVKP